MNNWIFENSKVYDILKFLASPMLPAVATMSGPEVKAAQCLLRDKFGYKIDIDGYFGPASERVVKDFQKKKGIEVDGIVGGQTWNALLK